MDYLDFKPVRIPPADPGVSSAFWEMIPVRIVLPAPEPSFGYIELEPLRRMPPPDYDINICRNCGYVNPGRNDYCEMCQMEISRFRDLELETVAVKVKVKFPKLKDQAQCDLCGTFNRKDQPYCGGCMSPL